MSESGPPFERTRSGKIGRFNFYKAPLIWVEGDDDVVFFRKLLKDTCRLESANGRPECEFLINELVAHNWPYAVVTDGDYDVFSPRPAVHERTLKLARYAIENYLLETAAVQSFCQDYMATQDDVTNLENRFNQFAAELRGALQELVVLDALNQEHATGAKSFPASAAELISKTLVIDRPRIATYLEQARAGLAGKDCVARTQHLKEFIDTHGIGKVLRGHFALGIIRLLIVVTLKEEDTACHIDNRGMLAVLAASIWEHLPTQDHSTLAKQLHTLVTRTQLALDSHLAPVQLELEGSI